MNNTYSSWKVKERWKVKIVLLSLVILFFTLFNTVAVHSLGVAPSREVIDYDQADHTVTIRIINNEHKDMHYLVYAQGELAKYVNIDASDSLIKSTEDEKTLTYHVKLPAGIEPGPKTLQIGIVEVPDKMASNSVQQDKTTIFSSVVVLHELQVNVPYPGKFAEGYLSISDGNVNDTIQFTASIFNRGSDTINSIHGELVIKGPTNEELYRIKSNNIEQLGSKGSDKLTVSWPANVNTGAYYAEFIITYDDKQIVLRKTFNIGSYYVDIKSLKVDNFKLGTIAKMDVELVNKWNLPIKEVYGELFVLDTQGNVVSKMKTVSKDLDPLTSNTVSGYWDTNGMTIGTYDVKAVVYYANKFSEKLFKAVVGIDSITVQGSQPVANVVAGSSGSSGGLNSVLLTLVIILIVINIGWFIYFKFMRKKEV